MQDQAFGCERRSHFVETDMAEARFAQHGDRTSDSGGMVLTRREASN